MGKVSPEHLDALCEMDNIALGAAATRLEKAAGIQVKMIKPQAHELVVSEAISQIPVEDKVFLIMKFEGDYSGRFAFVFSEKDIRILIGALAQNAGVESDIERGLLEVGKEIGAAIVESLAMLVMKTNIVCGPVEIARSAEAIEGDVVLIEMQFKLDGGKVDSRFWHIVPVDLGERLAADMLGEIDAQLQQFEEKAKEGPKAGQEEKKQEQLKDIPDIMVQVAVRLASKRMFFQELWELSPGAVIEFPQYVSQPVDVVMKGKTIAKAQVVTVGEKFGVRVTEVKNYAQGIGS